MLKNLNKLLRNGYPDHISVFCISLSAHRFLPFFRRWRRAVKIERKAALWYKARQPDGNSPVWTQGACCNLVIADLPGLTGVFK
jgi:hypothetical protein